MTAPAGRRLAGWLAGERPAARSWPAAPALVALAAGVGAGWLAARGWQAGQGTQGAGGDAGLLAGLAVVLAAGNGYSKAYSP
ncbi:MAG TPA: hypothetical protein VEL03_14565 [Streptosporangiaceae bacterium]|nr:hypothetical protein [Streptosporangiaceae bacterium]